MKKLLTQKEIMEVVKTSLELAWDECQVVSESYFSEETLRYIVANQISAVLSKNTNLVSFPNKEENKYKLVFEYPYTKNKITTKKNVKADLAVIRKSATKFNDAKHGHFYKKIYQKTIYENKGIMIGNEVLGFDTNENSFAIYSTIDKDGNYICKFFISDLEAYQKYQGYKEKVGKELEYIDFETSEQYNGNLMIIELKQFSSYNEIIADIDKLKGMLDSNKGFEYFSFGVFINFGFTNDEARKDLVNYLKSETINNKNLLIAYLDAKDNKSAQLKWIN